MLKLLLKTRFLALADQFSGQSKGKRAISVRRIVLLAVAALLLLALAGYVVSLLLTPLYKTLLKSDLEWLYFALTGVGAFLISFMLTAFYAQGSIFEAKDNEMLLSMPVRPSAILGSRLGALYFLNFFFAAAFMAAAGIVKLTGGGTAVAGGVIIYVLCVFLLALISTTLSCLLGWAVSLITRRMRNKAIFQLVFSLLLLGGFYVFFFGDITRHLKTVTENSAGIANVFRGALYPFHAMGMACTGKGFTEFLIFAAICIVPFVLVCLLLNKSFVKIVTSRVGAKRIKYEAKTLKGSSVAWAMTKKDLSRFFNNSSYMLNSGLGLIYSIGMSVFVVVSFLNRPEGAAPGSGFLDKLFNAVGTDNLSFLFCVFLAFFAAMTSISGPSISVEGKNLWILKSMPVRAAEILKGKVFSHLLLSIPASLICSAIFLFVLPKASAAVLICLFIMPILAHIFCALVGVIGNLYMGKLNYPSIAKAAKSNSGSLIPALSTMVVSTVPAILYLTVLKEQGITLETVIWANIGLLALLDTALYAFLHSSMAQKRWDALGQ